MNPRKKALELVKKFQSRNPFEIIGHLNIILVVHPLEDVRGFYQYFKRNNIIYIDERLSEKDKAFVLAHELGHMFLHKGDNAIFMDTRTQFNTHKYEIEADRFAVNLLISDEELEEHLDYTMPQLSRLFGYHGKLIELRIKDFE